MVIKLVKCNNRKHLKGFEFLHFRFHHIFLLLFHHFDFLFSWWENIMGGFQCFVVWIISMLKIPVIKCSSNVQFYQTYPSNHNTGTFGRDTGLQHHILGLEWESCALPSCFTPGIPSYQNMLALSELPDNFVHCSHKVLPISTKLFLKAVLLQNSESSN